MCRNSAFELKSTRSESDQNRLFFSEKRQFLIRKDEFDQLKEEREQFVATGGTGFDENWWKTAMGWNRESLYSGLQNAGKFFTPDILGQITGRACLSSLKSYQLASTIWQQKKAQRQVF